MALQFWRKISQREVGIALGADWQCDLDIRNTLQTILRGVDADSSLDIHLGSDWEPHQL